MDRFIRKMIGSRFADIRTSFGLSQKDFATRIGVGASSLSDIEKGKCVPSDRVISLLLANCGECKEMLVQEFGDIFVK